MNFKCNILHEGSGSQKILWKRSFRKLNRNESCLDLGWQKFRSRPAFELIKRFDDLVKTICIFESFFILCLVSRKDTCDYRRTEIFCQQIDLIFQGLVRYSWYPVCCTPFFSSDRCHLMTFITVFKIQTYLNALYFLFGISTFDTCYLTVMILFKYIYITLKSAHGSHSYVTPYTGNL